MKAVVLSFFSSSYIVWFLFFGSFGFAKCFGTSAAALL
jgi:hypothetical protein